MIIDSIKQNLMLLNNKNVYKKQATRVNLKQNDGFIVK